MAKIKKEKSKIIFTFVLNLGKLVKNEESGKIRKNEEWQNKIKLNFKAEVCAVIRLDAIYSQYGPTTVC